MTSYLLQARKIMMNTLSLKSVKKPKGGSESKSHKQAKESVCILAKAGKTLFEVDGRTYQFDKPSFIEIEKVWWFPAHPHGRKPVPGFSADVMMVIGERKIAVEVVVSNPPSQRKLAFYQDQNIECWVVKPCNVAVEKIKFTTVTYTGSEVYDFSNVSWDRPADLFEPLRARSPRKSGKSHKTLVPYDKSKDGMLDFLKGVRTRYNAGGYTNLECLMQLKTDRGFDQDVIDDWSNHLDKISREELQKTGWIYRKGFLVRA